MLGKCQHCGKYGHKSHLCRNRKTDEDTESAKRAKEGKNGKGKGKEKKEDAKRAVELIENLTLDSPANSSDEETSDDNSGDPSPRIGRLYDQNPSTRRAKRAMEFIDSVSDLKVITTLDRSKLATKVKQVKTVQGQSHSEGQVSNSTSFRNARDEVFLFASGAGVNIIGENIAIDNKIKVYKLQQKRQIVEASGNLLDIIGSCEIFVKIPFLKTIKKLECLVLRGNDVDREILVSCETLKKWDIIHCTFGQETVTNYINRCKLTRTEGTGTPL